MILRSSFVGEGNKSPRLLCAARFATDSPRTFGAIFRATGGGTTALGFYAALGSGINWVPTEGNST